MQVLKEITLDKVINLYEGQVVHDKKQLIEWTIIAALHSMS